MIGTSPEAKGGIAAVVQGYYDSGIMDRLNIRYFPTHEEGSKIHKIFFFLTAFIKIMTNIASYNIVHLHTASGLSFLRLYPILVLAKGFRKKVVFHIHGGRFDYFYDQIAPSWGKAMIRHAFSSSDRIVVLTDEWSRKLSHICNSEKITILPNTRPINISNEGVGKALVSKPRTLLFMGELCERKGVYDIINGMKQLETEKAQIEVLLCGQGEQNEIETYIKKLNLEGTIKLLGWVSGQKKEELLQKAYLFLLPSFIEGLPISILEAMASATPIIATDVGGIPELIKDGYNGYLIPVKSPEQLAIRTDQLLNDENLWMKMAENALSTIKSEFSMQHAEQKLIDLYRSIQ